MNVNCELLVTRNEWLKMISARPNRYVLDGVKFLFDPTWLDCTYVVVCFLEVKESEFIPPRECNLTVFTAVSMKYCSIAVFKLYFLCFFYSQSLLSRLFISFY